MEAAQNGKGYLKIGGDFQVAFAAVKGSLKTEFRFSGCHLCKCAILVVLR